MRKVEDNYIVVMWDWMADAPFFVKKYPAGGTDNFYQVAGHEMARVAKEHFKGIDGKDEIDSLKPTTPAEINEIANMILFDITSPEGWSKGEMEAAADSLEELADDFNMAIYATPFTADQDRREEVGLSG